MPEVIRELDGPRRALLEKTLQDLALRGRTHPGPNPAPTAPLPADGEAPFPLTDLQQAYWIGRSTGDDTARVACHAYTEVDTDDLDVERLTEALNGLVRRHPMLRAVIRPDGKQQIQPDVGSYRIRWEPQERLQLVREEMSHQVLRSDTWPLFDVRVTPLADGRTRVHLSIDVLIADALSFRTLAEELVALYRDPEHPLPPLGLTFRDVVAWEEEQRQSADHRRASEYWQARLASLPPPPALPVRQRPPGPRSIRFRRLQTAFDTDAWSALRTRGQAAGVTPSTVLLAAFVDVLGTWSASARMTLNLTVFTREHPHPDINRIVGPFTSISLLEVEATPGRSFPEQARAVQSQLWADLEHRSVSGVEVLRRMAREQGQPAVAMPVVFTSVIGAGDGDFAGPLSQLGTVGHSISQTPGVWIDCQVAEDGGRLRVWWDIQDGVLPDGVAEEMFTAYTALLGRLAADEASWSLRSGRVTVPSAATARLAHEVKGPSEAVLLQDLVDRQAFGSPDRVAVTGPGGAVTYAQLVRTAHQLGHVLRAKGVAPGQLVGISLDKSWHQVGAVLGVLHAGAAYLPLDPQLPEDRVRELARRSRLGIIVAAGERPSGVPGRPDGIEVVPIDGPDVAEAPTAAPEPMTDPSDLAYVIYTSGSTGQPKGVMITHAAAAGTILDVNSRLGLGPEDRVLALSSLAFDLSVWDIFGPLAVGGTVVMPSPGFAAKDPGHWLDLVRHHGVTVWNSVPALMGLLVDRLELDGDAAPVGAVRLVMLSGDWIPVSLPDRIRARFPGVRVVSLGGATEASIWSVIYEIGAVDPAWASIPYGYPLTNQTAYVLDDNLVERPLWVPGELHIGGTGVASGYWDDPELTRAAFVTGPTGERLYRTGDIARRRPDGALELLGRRDGQVKIRGHRIEVGEIESALARIEGVTAAAVVTEGGDGRHLRLVAYVGGPATELTPESVRARLQTTLPDYMVPTRIVRLASLPLSANGKVDRARLAALAGDDAPAGSGPAPATATGGPVVAYLTHIVEETLGRSGIDSQTNLLAFGADSIDIARIGNVLASRLDFRPALEDVFAKPTIAAVADAFQDEILGRLLGGERLSTTTQPHAAPAGEMLVDPADRERFRASQPGYRPVTADSTPVALSAGPRARPIRRRWRAIRSRGNLAAGPVPLHVLAGVLGALRRVDGDVGEAHLYPSPGWLYGVRCFLAVAPDGVDTLPAGIYSYDPRGHALDPVDPEFRIPEAAFDAYAYRPAAVQARFCLFLVGHAAAYAPLYGADHRTFAAIEAGAMLQLLRAEAQGRLALLPVPAVDQRHVPGVAWLEPGDTILVSILGGLPGPEEEQ
nr:condensation domain-containing protein [uncultured bacterium]